MNVWYQQFTKLISVFPHFDMTTKLLYVDRGTVCTLVISKWTKPWFGTLLSCTGTCNDYKKKRILEQLTHFYATRPTIEEELGPTPGREDLGCPWHLNVLGHRNWPMSAIGVFYPWKKYLLTFFSDFYRQSKTVPSSWTFKIIFYTLDSFFFATPL